MSFILFLDHGLESIPGAIGDLVGPGGRGGVLAVIGEAFEVMLVS